VPAEGDPKHPAFMEGLQEVYRQHAHEGYVHFEYTTQVYYGQFT
jgi:hypothetical protein